MAQQPDGWLTSHTYVKWAAPACGSSIPCRCSVPLTVPCVNSYCEDTWTCSGLSQACSFPRSNHKRGVLVGAWRSQGWALNCHPVSSPCCPKARAPNTSSCDWPYSPAVFGGGGGVLVSASRYSRRAWWSVLRSRLKSLKGCLVQALISVKRTPLGRLM